MIKKITTLLLFLGFAAFAGAQTMLVTTTLSSSVPASVSSASTTGNPQVVIVGSATGISAPQPNTGNTYGLATSEVQTFLYVDRELMQVKAVNGTAILVIRGVGSTAGTSHASSALVFVIPAVAAASFGFDGGFAGQYPQVPAGSCTRSNELYLPRIQFSTGTISDCLGGQWVNGDAQQTQRQSGNAFLSPYTGGTLYTSLDTNGTAPGASTEEYCTEIDLPYSKYLTGIAILNGTGVGTDKHLVDLRDASGNVLANSAVAGATSSGASTFQKYAFTSQYFAVGPARYFGCWQSNGTTDTVRRLDTSADQGLLAGKLTGQTFGTIVSATMPTTFTTGLGAYIYVY